MDWAHLFFRVLLYEVVFCWYETQKGFEGVVVLFEGRSERR